MSDSKRAVDAVTVLGGRVHRCVVLIMARRAHVVGTKAAEKGCGATVLALPVNLIGAVLIAFCCACTNLFEKTVLAE